MEKGQAEKLPPLNELCSLILTAMKKSPSYLSVRVKADEKNNCYVLVLESAIDKFYGLFEDASLLQDYDVTPLLSIYLTFLQKGYELELHKDGSIVIYKKTWDGNEYKQEESIESIESTLRKIAYYWPKGTEFMVEKGDGPNVFLITYRNQLAEKYVKQKELVKKDISLLKNYDTLPLLAIRGVLLQKGYELELNEDGRLGKDGSMVIRKKISKTWDGNEWQQEEPVEDSVEFIKSIFEEIAQGYWPKGTEFMVEKLDEPYTFAVRPRNRSAEKYNEQERLAQEDTRLLRDYDVAPLLAIYNILLQEGYELELQKDGSMVIRDKAFEAWDDECEQEKPVEDSKEFVESIFEEIAKGYWPEGTEFKVTKESREPGTFVITHTNSIVEEYNAQKKLAREDTSLLRDYDVKPLFVIYDMLLEEGYDLELQKDGSMVIRKEISKTWDGNEWQQEEPVEDSVKFIKSIFEKIAKDYWPEGTEFEVEQNPEDPYTFEVRHNNQSAERYNEQERLAQEDTSLLRDYYDVVPLSFTRRELSEKGYELKELDKDGSMVIRKKISKTWDGNEWRQEEPVEDSEEFIKSIFIKKISRYWPEETKFKVKQDPKDPYTFVVTHSNEPSEKYGDQEKLTESVSEG